MIQDISWGYSIDSGWGTTDAKGAQQRGVGWGTTDEPDWD